MTTVAETTETLESLEPTRGPARRRGGLLWQREFRLLWTGRTVSTLGNAVSGVAMPLVALQVLHSGPATLGLLNAASWLPWLVVGLPAGALIDRLPRRATMLVCNLIWTVLVGSVPVAAALGVLTVAQLVAVCLLGGVVSVFFSPAYQAYLPALLAKDDLAEGNAKLQGAGQAAVVGGSGLGGLLVQALGAVSGMVLDAASFLFSAACLLLIRTRATVRQAPAARRTTLRREISEGLRFVARDPYLRVMTIGAAVDNLLLAAGHALLVVFLIRSVGVGAGTVGLLMAFDCLGGVFGAAVANRLARRLGTARALLALSLGSTPFGLLIPLTHGGWGLACYAAGLFVPSAGIVAVNVIGATFRQSYCPPDMLGRITTSGSFVSFGLIPLGALLGGVLGAAIGVRETLALALAAGAVGKLILLAGPIRKSRDLPLEATP
ncbi:MAG: MFS transporter [Mycobacteriales bacterium]